MRRITVSVYMFLQARVATGVRRAVGLMAMLIAPWAVAVAQPIDVNVELRGELVVVDVKAAVSVKHAVAWAVLTDYEHMAQYVSNLTTSVIRKRNGNHLEVEQTGEARRGPLTFAFSTVRAVELTEPREIHSTLVRGEFKTYEFTTRLSAESNNNLVMITHHGEYVPNRWVPPLIGPSLIEGETRKQYGELIAEMMRRQAAKAAPR